MVFNSDANNLDIVTFSNKLVKQTNTSFPLAEKVLYANEAERIIQSWIHEAYGGWMYDDKNFTDLPEATSNLSSGVSDYIVPTDTSKVIGISYKNTGGTWNKLSPLTYELIPGSESAFYSTNSTPTYYRLLANLIRIYPAPNFSVTDGLKIYYSRDISGFTVADTTKTPGFDTVHHEAVPTYMAWKFAQINQLSNKVDLEKDWLRYEQRIKSDYSQRFAQLFPPRLLVRDAVREAQ